MTKFYSTLIFFFWVLINSYAQTTVSYGQISSYCPQTGQMLGGGGAVAITFYDGYILHPLYGKLFANTKNRDGSVTYIPSNYAGSPAMQLNAVLVSGDFQRIEERMTSSMGYASINIINTYTSMGEDGGRGAQRWADADAASRRGRVGGNNRESGTCRSCGGTGVSKTPNTGGSRTSWVAYYNSAGNKCPYCGGYTNHFHDKCSSCNVPTW